MSLYLPNYDVSAKEIDELLKEPDNFAYHGPIQGMFHTWGIGPVVDGRDFDDIAAKVNASVLMDRLAGHENWRTIRCGHWGFGWIEHLVFKVREEPGVSEVIDRRLDDISNAFTAIACETMDAKRHIIPPNITIDNFWRELNDREHMLIQEQGRLLDQRRKLTHVATTECKIVMEWKHQIEEYPILDEDAYYTELEDGLIDNIMDIARHVRDDAPQQWPGHVAAWLRLHEPAEVDVQSDGSPAYPSSTSIQRALAALGYEEDLCES